MRSQVGIGLSGVLICNILYQGVRQYNANAYAFLGIAHDPQISTKCLISGIRDTNKIGARLICFLSTTM